MMQNIQSIKEVFPFYFDVNVEELDPFGYRSTIKETLEIVNAYFFISFAL